MLGPSVYLQPHDNRIIQKLYEDKVLGNISEEHFHKMSPDYETEQKALEARATVLKKALDTAKEQSLNTDRFLGLVRKYTQIPHLDAEIIREFIDRITVFKTKKVNGRRTQRIRISYNCIGEINIPEEDEKRHSRYKRLCRIFQRLQIPI